MCSEITFVKKDLEGHELTAHLSKAMCMSIKQPHWIFYGRELYVIPEDDGLDDFEVIFGSTTDGTATGNEINARRIKKAIVLMRVEFRAQISKITQLLSTRAEKQEQIIHNAQDQMENILF